MSDNDWKNRLGVVFSTNPGYEYETASDPVAETLPPEKQNLRVTIDRRNRGGKQVTLVNGFVGNSDDLSQLCKTLKQKCGIGGSAKDGEIVLQGDFRDRVMEILSQYGYKVKRGN